MFFLQKYTHLNLIEIFHYQKIYFNTNILHMYKQYNCNLFMRTVNDNDMKNLNSRFETHYVVNKHVCVTFLDY